MSEASFAIPGDCDGGDVQKTIPAQQFCRIRADPPVARDVARNMSSNWTPAAMRSGRPEDDRGGAWQHPAKRRSRHKIPIRYHKAQGQCGGTARESHKAVDFFASVAPLREPAALAVSLNSDRFP